MPGLVGKILLLDLFQVPVALVKLKTLFGFTFFIYLLVLETETVGSFESFYLHCH